ncbi:retrovirus-related Pol polyprotein from transposon gypsy [Trichonephila clavipes]|nr:retrovirus-related Pol polyprotein from transposon gypsy [Trichonephila clavipes]
MKAPVLKLPDFKKPFELFVDASSIRVGAVLNPEHRPVVFASRTLSIAERNYTVTERECLAVDWALNKFRTYLSSLPIKVFTDHAALTRLTHGKNFSNRMIRYLENPEDSSVNATIGENWSSDFGLIEGLLFYAKYETSLGEMRVYIPKTLRNEIMREFHECNMFGCMEDTSLRIASFSSDRLDGPDRYTRDFKYHHNQKSAGVKSGDR